MSQMLDQFSTYMVILKWNRATHVSEMNIYKYKHNNDVPIYKLRPEMYYFDFENPICEQTGEYNNDFDMRSPQDCQIHSFPVQLANIKYYNKYLEEKESIKESCKYATNHDNCVICDLVRPLDSGHGYAVR